MEGFMTEFGGSKKGFFNRNIYMRRDENFDNGVEKFLKDFKNTDVYYGVYNYEIQDIKDVNECALYGSLYIDLDHEIEDENSFEKIKWDTKMTVQYFQTYFKIPKEMIQVYFSGSKGFHVVIPAVILGILPDKELNIKFKTLAMLISRAIKSETIDTRIYDRKRLFRMPNSINGKTGLYKVPIPLDMLWECTLDDMREWASEPRDLHFQVPVLVRESALHYHNLLKLITQKAKPESKKKREYIAPSGPRTLLPCVREILSNGAQKGQRNNTTVALASSILQSGKQLAEVIEILEEWNELNDPPLDERELHTTVTSAYQMFRSGKTYGCAAFKETGMCVGKECKLNE
jgi:hypothetical protein